MKNQTIFIISLVFLLIVGVGCIIAGEGGGTFTKTADLEKPVRDYLLNLIQNEEQGKEGTGEIQPTIVIDCAEKYCIWSAYQEGIINTQNNRFNRMNCTLFNYTSRICEEEITLTQEQIENLVIGFVETKLTDYVNYNLNSNYTLFSQGTVLFTEEE